MQDVFCHEGLLNMTYLALNLSDYVNGVAKKHRDVSRLMFAHHEVDAITNGVHLATWASRSFQELLDRRIPGWREDNFSLRYALGIPLAEIWEAHSAAKRELILRVNRETNLGMDVDLFTIGFARRAATYKRADLLFRDPARLAQIATRAGAIQVVYAGKAHPQDHGGKEIIKRVIDAGGALREQIKVAYLSQYDLALGGLITAGVDIWLNTPLPPREASGTSGMKAALNGVPSLSMSIGEGEEGPSGEDRSHRDANSLYDKLEQVIIPLFYQDREGFVQVMRQAIGLNGSFFNTHRMVQQYVTNAYFR
jgi:starch phosphorylase